jgi:hypothetical protein
MFLYTYIVKNEIYYTIINLLIQDIKDLLILIFTWYEESSALCVGLLTEIM